MCACSFLFQCCLRSQIRSYHKRCSGKQYSYVPTALSLSSSYCFIVRLLSCVFHLSLIHNVDTHHACTLLFVRMLILTHIYIKQACRNTTDLSNMACPAKYRHMNTFYKYYSGEKTAPVLTLYIGGNHEASNYHLELYVDVGIIFASSVTVAML